MAVAFDAASSARDTGTSISFSHTCAGADRCLIVFVSIDAPVDFSPAATYNSVDMGAIVNELFVGRYLAWFKLVAPATGPNTVAVTGLPGGGEEQAFAISFTGVHQTTPADTAETESDSAGATPHAETVPSASGDMVVSCCADDDSTHATAGGGASPAMTIPTNGSIDNADMSGAVAYQAGQASVTTEWASVAADRSIIAVNLNASAAAAEAARARTISLLGVGV